MNLHVLPPTTFQSNRAEISFGCKQCAWLRLCGGNYSAAFDCFAHCCGNPDGCSLACPNSRSFADVYRDSGGFDSYQRWDIQQDGGSELPEYIPCLQHSSSRAGILDVAAVAVPTHQLYSRTRDGGPRYSTATDLRRKFGVPRSCTIIAVTVGKDPKLETYWRYRITRGFLEHLAHLGVSHVIAPNFSMAAETVRTDHLANRRRSLICAQEFTRLGLSVVPYLGAVTDYDWEFWYWFLMEHSHLHIVAKEFQSGPANPERGRWHACRLLELEQKLGRGLHVVGIAAQPQIDTLRMLHRVTIIDSNPFSKAMHRRKWMGPQSWIGVKTRNGRCLNHLLDHNLHGYAMYISTRLAGLSVKSKRVSSSVGTLLTINDERQRRIRFQKVESKIANDTVAAQSLAKSVPDSGRIISP